MAQAAATSAGIQTSRASAYRLLRRVHIEGATALDDQRHRHPKKVRQGVADWLAAFCRAQPISTGRIVQAALLERFGLQISVSQINRRRAALGVKRPVPGAGENQPDGQQTSLTWHEGAGSLLLLAAAHETGVITALEQALPTGEHVAPRLAHATPTTRRQSLLTLLFLGAVGLRRPWDLRGYTGEALASLSGRQRAYGYCQCERFLSQVARAGGDETLTDALAQWNSTLRQVEDLKASERAMYELDHAKDQTMTVLKLALANLVMWTRDHYFPATYAQATWKRLEPFFRLPGRIVWGRDTVRVELRPFNDRRLTRDLAVLCQQVEAAQPSTLSKQEG